MANLIITIIGIALVAVAAIMGAYYAGTAFQQGSVNAIANAIISNSQQIVMAQRAWAMDNNQPDATGVYITALVAKKYLSSYPTTDLFQFGATTVNNGSWGDSNVITYQGSTTTWLRAPFTYNNSNYLFVMFLTISSLSVKNPYAKIATAINTSLGQLPGTTTT